MTINPKTIILPSLKNISLVFTAVAGIANVIGLISFLFWIHF